MATLALLLDKAKKARSMSSDNAFAVSMGWRRQVVSQWRNAESYPSEDHIAQLAEIAHEDPVEWLVRVKAERSEGAAAKYWARLARQLGAAAALALCVVPMLANAAPLVSQAERFLAMPIM